MKKQPLPDYEKPPVTEVVIGIQFNNLEKFGPVHAGLYWQRIRKKYPKFEARPPLGFVKESFGVKKETMQESRIEITQFPVPRTWFLKDDESRLVQLQSTHFFHNWKKVKREDIYPRYDVIKEEYKKLWEGFLVFVNEQNLGEVKPNIWELTYVNHIPQGQGWNSLKDIAKLFPCWSGATSENYLPEPENLALSVSYLFPEEKGRLHIKLDQVIRIDDNSEGLRLNLTARGKLDNSDINQILPCFEKGHEWIVRGFTDFTSQEAHNIWGRKE